MKGYEDMNLAIVLAEAKQKGLLDTLAPWQLLVGGLILVVIAVVTRIIDNKLDDDMFILELVTWICGIAGLIAIFQGLFGS